MARPAVSGRRCPGLHCPGCDSGGGLVALVVAMAVTGAVIHAIWHAIVEAAEIAALTVLAITGLATVAGIGYVVLRIRASMARSRAQTGPKAVIVGEVTHGSINAGHPPAIAPPRTSWPLPGQWEPIRRRDDITGRN
jgi:biotin transporter BioY